MSGGSPADVPTSADDIGRHNQPPAPQAALGGPAHAADTVFGADAMSASRRQLITENGDVQTTAVIIDRLEAGFGDADDAYGFDLQGWSGGDINRFWWKVEGEGGLNQSLHEAEAQALFSRAVTPFWNLQAGVRQDYRPDGPDTTHLALGFQGLARYWWEVDAAAFVSHRGDLTARLEAEYDQRITQRLILQPRIEAVLSASDKPELQLGSGLSNLAVGLRLRYEFTRELAPYVGVEWSQAFGRTEDYVRDRGETTDQVQWLVGIRGWF